MEELKNMINKVNLIWEEMRFLTNSPLRLELIKSFYVSDIMPLNEIFRTSGLNYSSVSSNIHKLEKRGFLKYEKGLYKIKKLSKIKFENLIELNMSIRFINKFSEYLNEHDIEELDDKHLKNVKALSTGELIQSNSIDIYKPLSSVKKNIEKSMILKSILPFIHPEYPEVIKNLINKEIPIQILIPKTLSFKFIKLLDDKTIQKGLKKEIFELRTLKNDTKLFLNISDKFMSLGLFKNNGDYDQNRILISNELEGIQWGIKLFNEYYEKSSKVFLKK